MPNLNDKHADRALSQPLFSVVIPTYNRAELITQAVQSVLSQTFSDFELIIIDDGSTDHTAEVVGQIEDPRLRYFQQSNKGRTAARNAGAARARGRYLTFLDSDDEATSDWLAVFVEAFQAGGIGIVCCGATVYRERSFEQEKMTRIRLPKSLGPALGKRGLFLTGTFAMRRELFEAVGGYVEELSFAENTELVQRLVPYCLESGLDLVSVDKPLVIFYNQRAFGGGNDFKARLDAAEYMLQHHGERWDNIPSVYANYCVIAGVNAARLGQYGHARHFFISAIPRQPLNVKHYGRLFLAMVPALGRRLWLRYDEN